jgi:hypothetical protein
MRTRDGGFERVGFRLEELDGYVQASRRRYRRSGYWICAGGAGLTGDLSPE